MPKWFSDKVFFRKSGLKIKRRSKSRKRKSSRKILLLCLMQVKQRRHVRSLIPKVSSLDNSNTRPKNILGSKSWRLKTVTYISISPMCNITTPSKNKKDMKNTARSKISLLNWGMNKELSMSSKWSKHKRLLPVEHIKNRCRKPVLRDQDRVAQIKITKLNFWK